MTSISTTPPNQRTTPTNRQTTPLHPWHQRIPCLLDPKLPRTVALSETEMLERAKKRTKIAGETMATLSSIIPPKVPRTATLVDAPKSARTPFQEGETFIITLPKNFCEITTPTIFPVAKKLVFSAPQRRLASLPFTSVASEGLALQIHFSV
ncbi:uncharacterized protein LOC125492664 [Beta vulgaris subsp. vulgaris]|uniref:uncharacterized protein LOC125492664 n=1 Tax=Beta vulgaris subsp. vulgaris TaxID=3555 RepID=UPI0020372420|nr:uncharacterized protein LOC125492664 [Beta vulgaris subsp. vulgaris]